MEQAESPPILTAAVAENPRRIVHIKTPAYEKDLPFYVKPLTGHSPLLERDIRNLNGPTLMGIYFQDGRTAWTDQAAMHQDLVDAMQEKPIGRFQIVPQLPN